VFASNEREKIFKKINVFLNDFIAVRDGFDKFIRLDSQTLESESEQWQAKVHSHIRLCWRLCLWCGLESSKREYLIIQKTLLFFMLLLFLLHEQNSYVFIFIILSDKSWIILLSWWRRLPRHLGFIRRHWKPSLPWIRR